MKAVTQETRKYLKDRLGRACSAQCVFSSWGRGELSDLPKPVEVIEAEKRIKRDAKIVDRFDKKNRKQKERRQDRKKAAYRAVEALLMMGSDSRAALKAIERFENKKF